MTEYLVIGGSGQVGGFLREEMRARGASCAGTYHRYPVAGLRPLDVGDGAAVRAVIREVAPAVVFLPASLTHVDRCQEHPAEGFRVNVAGAAAVCRAAAEVGARVVYFSSDYVFNGAAGPYHELSVPDPISVYGWQKLQAEHYALACTERVLIVRTTGVYGWEPQGKNFVARLVATLESGGTMQVPEDQVGTPAYGPDVARAVMDLVERDAAGVLHVAGSERASRYAFAVAAAEAFGLDPALLLPVPTAELGQPAPRPLEGGLDAARAERILGRHFTGYTEGLERMAAERAAP